MKFVVEIAKKKIVAKSKNDLLKKIGAARYVFGSNSNWELDYKTNLLVSKENNGNNVRLFSIQKFNPKTKVITKKITRGINKGNVVTSRERVREGHWEAYVLDVPRSFIKEAKQNEKNYTVVFNDKIKM